MTDYKQLVTESESYALVIAEPVSNAWKGWPLVFQIRCKEFGVVVDEGANELQARYYLDHYTNTKSIFKKGGMAALTGEVEGPGEFPGA